MNITVVAWGGQGDFIPCAALALGLQKAGHSVKFATHIEEQEFIESLGLECLPIDWEAAESPILINRQPFITIIQNSDQIKLPKNSLLNELWRVCQNTEAIIFNGPSYPCYYIAEKLNIPCFAVSPQPHHQTIAFPHPFVTDGKSKGSIYNWLSYLVFDQIFWQYIRQPINRWRQEKLQLPLLSFSEGLVGRMKREKIPFLYSYSSAFLPQPADWDNDYIHVTGYWFLEPSKTWEAPQDLIDFLSTGEPPIYISNIWHQETLGTELVREICQLTKQRIIVHGLDNDDSEIEASEQIFYVQGFIAYEWLFPQVSVAVHHGGCGTIHSCLRAGVPMVVIPYQSDNDQAFWSLQIEKYGLGIALLPEKETISAKKLASAIQKVIGDEQIQQRVKNIAKQVQLEDGINKAIEVFNGYFK
ncbi:MAG TPA: glycosyltransferase [Coleofasciculaceae cyanobacterium]|jgi:UDP:flavonoid glycosyltransferase YjiC (YdhE family)